VLDLEDFIVSNNLLPLGSLAFVLFCTRRNGWGWDGFIAEADAGKGLKFPHFLKGYITYGLPLIIILIYLKGYWDMFSPMGTAKLACWMAAACVFLAFVFFCAVFAGGKKKERTANQAAS
jgi:NSS family neurotransmitter:Na+ symporter